MPDPRVTVDERWLWLGGSFLSAVLLTNLAWVFRKPRSGKIGEFVSRLIAWRFSPWLWQFLRLLYYVGVPSTALMWRKVVVMRHLGLLGGTETIAPTAEKWADWAHSLGWAATLGIGTWVLLGIGWWTYRRATANIAGKGQIVGSGTPAWVLLREAIYHEAHWAFYRNAPIVTMLERGGDVYWGIWAGLAIVALEAILNPAWRRCLTDPQTAPAHLMRGALAIISSVLFWETHNLWLAVALHFLVSWGLIALTQALPLPPAREPDQAHPR